MLAVVEAAARDGAGFAEVIGRLDRALVDLWSAHGPTEFLVNVHPDEAVRSAAQDAQERLSTWRRSLALRDDLGTAVLRYASSADAGRCAGEERRLVDHGSATSAAPVMGCRTKRVRRLRRLTARSVTLEGEFERNLAEWSDGIDVTPADLAGLPEAYVTGLKPGTAPGTLRISLDYPDYFPFMGASPRRDLREALARKMASRAVEANWPILEELFALRRRQAGVLGYASWATLPDRAQDGPHAGARGSVPRGAAPATPPPGHDRARR